MYDELARIESIYGSVAEYNRCMEEEMQEEYTPTLEEYEEQHIDLEVYHKKIEYLSGAPSDFVVKLKADWDERAPKEDQYPKGSNQFIYDSHDFYTEMVKDIMHKLCEHYNVTPDDKGDTFYNPEVGKLAISVDYSDSVYIKHLNVGNLDYETFKDIFRDMYYAHLYPSMSLGLENRNHLILSNCSLGNLRIYDFKMAGLETEESLNKDLMESGFDEEKFRNELKEQLLAEREEDGLDDR